jgi:hypothetical protein
MVCEVGCDSGELVKFPGQSQIIIDLDDLKAKDKVVIRTRNSTYRFLLTDPAKRLGVLTGGALGNSTRDAALIESVAVEENAKLERSSGLRTGARILFYLSSPRGAERMATSVVEELVVIRSEEELPRIA